MGTNRLRTSAHVLLVISALGIGACTRSASSASTPTGGAVSTASPLTGQQATMEAVRSALLTQTAQAVQGGAGNTSTPTTGAGVMTATPGVGVAGTIVVTPAGPTKTPFPIPALVVPATYTLHEGEFPYCLGRRFNRNPDDILALNGLKNSSVTVPGETLTIPTSGTFPGSRALLSHPTSYSVAGGDTIYSVACYYGDVDPMAIAAVNGLSSPYTLNPGSMIQIP